MIGIQGTWGAVQITKRGAFFFNVLWSATYSFHVTDFRSLLVANLLVANLLVVTRFSLQTPGGSCHVYIRGCVCHIFGSKIALESHIFGSKICSMNFPFFGGKTRGVKIFSNCNFFSVQFCNTSITFPCHQIYD